MRTAAPRPRGGKAAPMTAIVLNLVALAVVIGISVGALLALDRRIGGDDPAH